MFVYNHIPPLQYTHVHWWYSGKMTVLGVLLAGLGGVVRGDQRYLLAR